MYVHMKINVTYLILNFPFAQRVSKFLISPRHRGGGKLHLVRAGQVPDGVGSGGGGQLHLVRAGQVPDGVGSGGGGQTGSGLVAEVNCTWCLSGFSETGSGLASGVNCMAAIGWHVSACFSSLSRLLLNLVSLFYAVEKESRYSSNLFVFYYLILLFMFHDCIGRSVIFFVLMFLCFRFQIYDENSRLKFS